ncbi:MAG: FIG00003370: Multicopper polyphenol oxidase, partial [uncultured Rubrobacteraceae bacterium]
ARAFPETPRRRPRYRPHGGRGRRLRLPATRARGGKGPFLYPLRRRLPAALRRFERLREGRRRAGRGRGEHLHNSRGRGRRAVGLGQAGRGRRGDARLRGRVRRRGRRARHLGGGALPQRGRRRLRAGGAGWGGGRGDGPLRLARDAFGHLRQGRGQDARGKAAGVYRAVYPRLLLRGVRGVGQGLCGGVRGGRRVGAASLLARGHRGGSRPGWGGGGRPRALHGLPPRPLFLPPQAEAGDRAEPGRGREGGAL